jgi:peroxiredoxin
VHTGGELPKVGETAPDFTLTAGDLNYLWLKYHLKVMQCIPAENYLK